MNCNDSSKLKPKTIEFKDSKKSCINIFKRANKNGKLVFISSKVNPDANKHSQDTNTSESAYFDEIIDEFESINEEYEDAGSIDDLITESADSDNFSGILELVESL